MINIPSDLRKNKDTIVGNMDLRECICLFIGILLAIGILYYIRVILGYKRIVIAAFIGGIFVIPFLFVGFKKINGMKIDDYFKVFVNNKIIACSNRINICHYAETQVKNKKYEMIRYYRLNDEDELLTLRQHLIDKNILILTEYIDYKNEKLAVFRIDGKDLIVEEMRKNKVAIENKTKQIKDFIKNEIKPVRALKREASEDVLEFKNSKKEKLEELNNKLKELKLEKKYLQSKTFNDLKDEVDIFESIEHMKSERLQVKLKDKKSDLDDDGISNLRNLFNEDDRIINQLHLFNRDSFRRIIESINDKIVFINKENEVDLYYFGELNMELVDTNTLDKNQGVYKGTIMSLEARDLYNHYRRINSLEEIL